MRRLVTIVGLLLSLAMVGTVGLRIIEGANWLDCLFMAVITLTTVGYSEVVVLSDAGKIFIIVYLVGGLGIFTYSAFQLGQWVFSAQMRSLWERRQMEQAITKLSDHYIVCGQGRMGTAICKVLHERKKPFVVIDNDDEKLIETCSEPGWLYVVGDGTDDEVLVKAGIQKARALASVLPTDADNVYVILSARLLTTGLQIVARASDEKAIGKMERAGATRVISPFSSGAMKMARFMLNPSVEDFLEIADTQGNELELADIHIDEGSSYIGKQLMESDLRDKGVMVIGIRRSDGEWLMPPPGSAIIRAGDCLFAFGSTDAVNDMISEEEAAT